MIKLHWAHYCKYVNKLCGSWCSISILLIFNESLMRLITKNIKNLFPSKKKLLKQGDLNIVTAGKIYTLQMIHSNNLSVV